MESQSDLKQILKCEMLWYAQIQGYKISNQFLLNEELLEYSIVIVSDSDYSLERFTRVTMLARIEGDKIIIEADTTDKSLYEGLMHAGVPREKIILAYAGERLPTPQS